MIQADSPSPARHWPSELLLPLVIAALMLPFVFTTVAQGDEFTILNGVLRQVQGQVIYRDYFELTAPLATWLLVPFYKITGPSLLVARAVQAGLIVVAGWQLYRLARALGVGAWTATLPGLLLVLGLYRVFPGYLHHWMVLPFLLGALQAGLRGLETAHRRWWALAGVLASGTLLSMQSDGLVLFVALASFLVARAWLERRDWRDVVLDLAATGAGAALAIAPAAIYLAARHALGPAIYDTLLWPMQHYKQPGNFNDVKFGTDLAQAISPFTTHWISLPYFYAGLYFYFVLYALVPLAAVLIFAWGLPVLQRRWAQGAPWSLQQAKLALIALSALGLEAVLLRGRADTAHTAIYAVPVVLLACVGADWLARAGGEPAFALMRRLPLLGLAAWLVCGGVQQACAMRAAPGAWLSFRSPDRHFADGPVIRYLRTHAAPGDRVVGMPFGGFFYFYGLPPATRYTLFAPTSYKYETGHEADRLLHEIAVNRPRFLVVSSTQHSDYFKEFLPRTPQGYRLVADFAQPGTPDRVPVYVFERDAATSAGLETTLPKR